MPSPLALGFGLPFEDAIAAATARGVVLPAEYYGAIASEIRRTATTVSGLATLAQIQEVIDSVTAALANGQSFREWQKAALAENWGLPAARLETIFRTNVQTSYSDGHWRSFRANQTRMPYLMWSAINDSRTRPAHAAMSGYIAPIDDPIWKVWHPPAGYNSLLPHQQVSGNVLIGLKARYAGPVTEIVGQSGARLSVTAQHPILTRRGWVAAKDVHVGDQLAAYRSPIGSGAVPAYLNEDNAPPTIKQVFDALPFRAGRSVPRSALNLYGDARFVNGNVEVVAANRMLMDRFEALVGKFLHQLLLTLPGSTLALLARLGGSDIVSRCALRGVGSLDGSGVSSRRRSVLDDLHAMFAQLARGYLPIDPELCGYRTHGPTVSVQTRSIFGQALREAGRGTPHLAAGNQSRGLRFGPLGNTRFADVFIGGLEINPDALRDALQAHPGSVEFEDVIDARTFDWSGHVYDLETASGNILAYGGSGALHYILSNCRCSQIQLTEAQARARGYGTQLPPTVQPDPGFAGGPGVEGAVAQQLHKAPPVLQAAAKVVMAPPPRGPMGAPVSQALRLPGGRGKTALEINDAMRLIDRVHGDGALPTIPVGITSGTRTLGKYKYYSITAKSVGLDVSRAGEHPRLTFAHEVGHFLDHKGWGAPGYSSAFEGAAEPWRKAIAASPEVQALRDLRTSGATAAIRKWARYATSWHELWARSYAQWIAHRSGDPRMALELTSVKTDTARQAYHLSQWGSVEFEPIAKALDDLFELLGWRNP